MYVTDRVRIVYDDGKTYEGEVVAVRELVKTPLKAEAIRRGNTKKPDDQLFTIKFLDCENRVEPVTAYRSFYASKMQSCSVLRKSYSWDYA